MPEDWLLFTEEPLDVKFLLDVEDAAPDLEVPARPTVCEASAAQVLLWWACHVGPATPRCQSTVRRRITKKRPVNIVHLLPAIRSGAWEALASRAPRSWRESVVLRNYFRGVLAKATGIAAIRSRAVTAKTWIEADTGVKGGWAVVQQIEQDSGVSGVRGDMHGGKQVTISGLGVLLTWHSEIGMSDPMVASLLAQGFEGAALLQRVKDLPFVDEAFEAFVPWVDSLRKTAGYSWWAACMEMCLQSEYPARIHFHAFMSVDPSRLEGRSQLNPPEIPASSLVYQGMAPNARPVMLTGRRRHTEAAFSGGMYYVLADKEGSLRVRGNKALFLDWRVLNRGGIILF